MFESVDQPWDGARCVFAAKALGEGGILDGIETNLGGCMIPIDPASGVPISDPAIGHESVQTLCESIDAEHPVCDVKRDRTFSGHQDSAQRSESPTVASPFPNFAEERH
jgi:hypothetical protein